MARFRRNATASRGGSGRQIVIILALIAALVLMVGGLGWQLQRAQTAFVARDPVTLCPLSGAVSQTIVLLDTTDPLASVTQTQLLQKLRDVVSSIPENGYFELWLLNADTAKTTASLKLCNPGDGTGIDPIIGAPKKALLLWQKKYVEVVEAALAAAVTGIAQDFSPIIEAIQLIAADRLTSAKDRALPNRLIVVSDMIQHTTSYSHYHDGVSMAAYTAGPAAGLSTDLAQADVEFWLVRRDTAHFSLNELSAFWMEWAETNNAKLPAKTTPLMGM